MTIEDKLKWLEQNEVYLANSGWTIIQALRKAISQRDRWIIAVYGYKSSWSIDDDKELLEILEVRNEKI